MVTYLGKFIPDVADKVHPLYLLTSTKNEFTWGALEQKCFEDLKSFISETPVLHHFDLDKPVTISVNASSYGIGAVLLQEDQLVAFTSATLTPTQ